MVVWLTGGAALVAAAGLPWLAPLAYVAIVYGVARFNPEFEPMLARGVPTAVTLAGLAAGAGWLRGHRPGWGTLGWGWLALVGVLAVWVVATAWVGASQTDWPPPLKRHPLWYFDALGLGILALGVVRGPREIVALAVVLALTLMARAHGFPARWEKDGDAGLLVSTALPLVLGAVLAVRRPAAVAGLLALAGYLAWLLYENQNRGAALGLVAGGGTFVVLALAALPVRWRLGLGALLLAGTAAAGVWFARTPYGERFLNLLNPASSDYSSADARLRLWRAGGAMLADHRLVGVGPGNFALRVRDYDPEAGVYVAHSNWVSVAAEMGWPGLAVWCLVLGTGLAAWVRLAWTERGTPRGWASCGGAAALVAFLVAGSFINRPDLALAFLLAGSGVALATAGPSRAGGSRGVPS